MIDQIRPAQFDAWLQMARAQSAVAPVLLDVREAWELQTASVQPEAADADGAGFGFTAIPMNEIPARLGELDASQPIACMCHHGVRSQRVALFLSQNGFRQVVNLAGGIDAWSAERDPAVPRY